MVERNAHPRKLEEPDYQNPRELQKQKDRTEIANQLVRGGLLMNGGGAVALLAFVQAVMRDGKHLDLIVWAASSIMIFVFGLGAVTWANYSRIKVSHRDNDPDSAEKTARTERSRILQLAPTAIFMFGCAVFASAILLKLVCQDP